jgi:hypothetical protein
MNILRRTFFFSLLVAAANASYGQEPVNVFELFGSAWRGTGFAEELEKGDFKEVWGQSLDELIVEIARLNLLFYEERDDTERTRLIRERIGETELPAYSYLFLPDVNAFSVIDHESGSNRITISGGYVVLAYLISCCYSYEQYCQIYREDNRLRTGEFLAALEKMVRQNWFCRKDTAEYRELAAFSREYGRMERESGRLREDGERQHSLYDHFITNFQFLMLYIYAHEIGHIVLGRDNTDTKHAAIEEEITVDMSAARFLFTRVRGGWGVGTGEEKTKAVMEPVLLLLEFLAKIHPGLLEGRIANFLRHYVWAESYYANIE